MLQTIQTIQTNVSIVKIFDNIVNKTYCVRGSFDYGIAQALTTELCILNMMDGKNSFPKILDFVTNSPKYTIIMPNLGQPLGKIDVQPVLEVFTKILEKVIILHDHNIVHCDLKMNNILQDKNGNVSVIDFSHSFFMGNYIKNGFTIENHQHDYTFGTNVIMPPEVFVNPHNYDCNEKIDVWSLGCCLFYMITGRILFRKIELLDDEQICGYIERELMKIDTLENYELEKQIMKQIFQFNPVNRPSVGQLLNIIGVKNTQILLYDATYIDTNYYKSRQLRCDYITNNLSKYVDNLYNAIYITNLYENHYKYDRYELLHLCHMVVGAIFLHIFDMPSDITIIKYFDLLRNIIREHNMSIIYKK